MDIVEAVKEGNRIEDIAEELGYGMERRRGRYLHGKEHDSLVIDVQKQAYFWNSKNEAGDVIRWVELRKGYDFKTAVEWLARRAKLPDPQWGQGDLETRKATRVREDAFQVAAEVFFRRCTSAEVAAAYVRGRGWTDETREAARLGYTGEGSAAERKELEGELRMHQVDLGSGAAKAALGMPAGMLVYPHYRYGRVKYLSCRSVEGKRHYNLPRELAGERQMYFNQAYDPHNFQVVMVEGQADGVTLGQWEVPAIAMAGVSFADHQAVFDELKKLHKVIYVGMDADEAGLKALVGRDEDWPLGFALGPMARVVQWGARKYA